MANRKVVERMIQNKRYRTLDHPEDMIAFLLYYGAKIKRVKGSHYQFEREWQGKVYNTTVSVGKPIKAPLVKQILKEMGFI